jgi:hypothetical protein
MNPIASLARNLLLSIDQLGNSILLGSADETISARSYRRGVLEGSKSWLAMNWVVNKLFWFDDNHTQEAYRNEMDRCQLPPEYKTPGELDPCVQPEKPDA